MAGISEVVIGVGDLDDAVTFYTQVCGLRYLRTVEDGPVKVAELDAGGQRVTLVVSAEPGVRLALRSDDIQADHRRLRRKKAALDTEEVVRGPGIEWTGFRDPWGTRLLFWQAADEE